MSMHAVNQAPNRGLKRLGLCIEDVIPNKVAKIGNTSPMQRAGAHPSSPNHSPARKSSRNSRKANIQVKVSEKLRQMVLRFLENARIMDDGVELSQFRQKFELYHNVSFDTTKLGVSPRDASLSLILKSIKGVKLLAKANNPSNQWVYRVPSYWSHFGNERIEGVVDDYCPEQGFGTIEVKHNESTPGTLVDNSVDRIFMHFSNLHILGGYREVHVGEKVECGVGKTPEGNLTAVAVTKRGDVNSMKKDRYLSLHRVAQRPKEKDPCLENGFTIKAPHQKNRGRAIRTCQEGPMWVQLLMSKDEKTSIDGARALLDILVKADPSNRRLADPAGGLERDSHLVNVTHPVPYEAEFARIVFQTSPWILKPLINLLQKKSTVRSMVLDIITRLVVPFTGEPPFINPALIAIPSTVTILSKMFTRGMDRIMYLKVLRVLKTVCIVSFQCRQKSRQVVVDYIANRAQNTVSAIEIHESLEVLRHIFASAPNEDNVHAKVGSLELNVYCRILKYMQNFLSTKKPGILGNVLHILTSLCYLWRPGMPIISIVLQSTVYQVITRAINNPPKTSKFDIRGLGVDLLSALLIPQASDTKSGNFNVGAFAVMKSMLLDVKSSPNRAIACQLVGKAVSWKSEQLILPVIEALIKSKMFHILQGYAILDSDNVVTGEAVKALKALLERLAVGNELRGTVESMNIPYKPSELDISTQVEKKMMKDSVNHCDNTTTPDFPIHSKPIITQHGLFNSADDEELDYLDDDQEKATGTSLQRVGNSFLHYNASQAILLVGDMHLEYSRALSAALHASCKDDGTSKKHPSTLIVASTTLNATELVRNDAELVCKVWPLRNKLAGLVLGVGYDTMVECLVKAASAIPTRLLGIHCGTHLRSSLASAQPCFERIILPFPSASFLNNLDRLMKFFRSIRSLLLKDAEVHVHVGVNPTECSSVGTSTFPSIGTEDLAERTQILHMAARNVGYRLISRSPFTQCIGYDLSKVRNASYEPTTYTFLPE